MFYRGVTLFEAKLSIINGQNLVVHSRNTATAIMLDNLDLVKKEGICLCPATCIPGSGLYDKYIY